MITPTLWLLHMDRTWHSHWTVYTTWFHSADLISNEWAICSTSALFPLSLFCPLMCDSPIDMRTKLSRMSFFVDGRGELQVAKPFIFFQYIKKVHYRVILHFSSISIFVRVRSLISATGATWLDLKLNLKI